ncbi:collagen alpha-1(I) chain-like [Elephas maximus indicus]|uniref:collagen alpha-1(I) chain-like n=1 Tax=Elephas maximus indicus TaxID=99487 RepID=UPI0021161ECF|nr:collagen alpha-1(I) chain-like [Elephas maximus indicus]
MGIQGSRVLRQRAALRLSARPLQRIQSSTSQPRHPRRHRPWSLGSLSNASEIQGAGGGRGPQLSSQRVACRPVSPYEVPGKEPKAARGAAQAGSPRSRNSGAGAASPPQRASGRPPVDSSCQAHCQWGGGRARREANGLLQRTKVAAQASATLPPGGKIVILVPPSCATPAGRREAGAAPTSRWGGGRGEGDLGPAGSRCLIAEPELAAPARRSFLNPGGVAGLGEGKTNGSAWGARDSSLRAASSPPHTPGCADPRGASSRPPRAGRSHELVDAEGGCVAARSEAPGMGRPRSSGRLEDGSPPRLGGAAAGQQRGANPSDAQQRVYETSSPRRTLPTPGRGRLQTKRFPPTSPGPPGRRNAARPSEAPGRRRWALSGRPRPGISTERRDTAGGRFQGPGHRRVTPEVRPAVCAPGWARRAPGPARLRHPARPLTCAVPAGRAALQLRFECTQGTRRTGPRAKRADRRDLGRARPAEGGPGASTAPRGRRRPEPKRGGGTKRSRDGAARFLGVGMGEARGPKPDGQGARVLPDSAAEARRRAGAQGFRVGPSAEIETPAGFTSPAPPSPSLRAIGPGTPDRIVKTQSPARRPAAQGPGSRLQPGFLPSGLGAAAEVPRCPESPPPSKPSVAEVYEAQLPETRSRTGGGKVRSELGSTVVGPQDGSAGSRQEGVWGRLVSAGALGPGGAGLVGRGAASLGVSATFSPTHPCQLCSLTGVWPPPPPGTKAACPGRGREAAPRPVPSPSFPTAAAAPPGGGGAARLEARRRIRSLAPALRSDATGSIPRGGAGAGGLPGCQRRMAPSSLPSIPSPGAPRPLPLWAPSQSPPARRPQTAAAGQNQIRIKRQLAPCPGFPRRKRVHSGGVYSGPPAALGGADGDCAQPDGGGGETPVPGGRLLGVPRPEQLGLGRGARGPGRGDKERGTRLDRTQGEKGSTLTPPGTLASPSRVTAPGLPDGSPPTAPYLVPGTVGGRARQRGRPSRARRPPAAVAQRPPRPFIAHAPPGQRPARPFTCCREPDTAPRNASPACAALPSELAGGAPPRRLGFPPFLNYEFERRAGLSPGASRASAPARPEAPSSNPGVGRETAPPLNLPGFLDPLWPGLGGTAVCLANPHPEDSARPPPAWRRPFSLLASGLSPGPSGFLNGPVPTHSASLTPSPSPSMVVSVVLEMLGEEAIHPGLPLPSCSAREAGGRDVWSTAPTLTDRCGARLLGPHADRGSRLHGTSN